MVSFTGDPSRPGRPPAATVWSWILTHLRAVPAGRPRAGRHDQDAAGEDRPDHRAARPGQLPLTEGVPGLGQERQGRDHEDGGQRVLPASAGSAGSPLRRPSNTRSIPSISPATRTTAMRAPSQVKRRIWIGSSTVSSWRIAGKSRTHPQLTQRWDNP
jgi:hypothetical protein